MAEEKKTCAPGTAVQDHYPDRFSHCYGCGRLNESGLHVRTCWADNEETVAYYRPRQEHRAQVKELKGRKVVVTSTLSAFGEVRARGEVVAIRVPADETL